jgi:Mn2+/Fe2+ NRAMP family transporter
MATESVSSSRARARFREAVPALITGGAGDDPSGVLTYTVVGATTGLSQLWLLLVSTPMLVAAVLMASRVARTSGGGLASVIRARYGQAVGVPVVALLLLANLATIAADVAGIAAALGLLTGLAWELFLLPILLTLALVWRVGYTRAKHVLTILALALVLYAVAAVLARPDWEQVVRATVTPRIPLDNYWLVAALGLLGTTISPYMLFWQANEEVEEARDLGFPDEGTAKRAVVIGMVFSNLVAFFIIVCAAATTHAHGGQINSIGDAARVLSPLGWMGDEIFVATFVGAGLLALPTLAGSSAFAVAELFGWPEGLDRDVARARGFYVVLGSALLGGAAISLWPGFHPAAALFYSQVLNGVLLPLLMLILLVLSNDARIVGGTRNPMWVNIVAVLTIVLASAATFAAVVS